MTRVLRVMIVDDEAPAREGLRLRLKREHDVLVVGEFGDPRRALDAIRSDPPDLLFLDIHMPGMDGFGLVERLAETGAPPIIFVTAFDEHAIRAFEINALDYLLKPVEQSRLHDALDRARKEVHKEEAAALGSRLRGLLADHDAARFAPLPTHPPSERIAIRVDGSIRFVEPADIEYVDAAGDSVRLHTGAASHLVRKSMAEILALLPAGFARIHRSTIVNVSRVRELQPYFHGEYIVIMQGGAKLKLSRGYRESAGRLLGI